MRISYNILWSKESKIQFDRIIAYLKQEWTEKEVKKFVSKLKTFEKIVTKFPEIYAISHAGLRRAVITKHNSVIFQIDSKEQIIRVYTIFDNRQNPKKLP